MTLAVLPSYDNILLSSSFSPAITPATWRPKWEKRLPKQLSVSALDAHRVSLILTVELCTTDTSKVHSNKALLDCRATGSFIDRDFVHDKGINTQSISYPISMFNVNGTPNKAGQISKVIDVVCYESPKQEKVSPTFEHLIQNLKAYNGVRI